MMRSAVQVHSRLLVFLLENMHGDAQQSEC